MAPSKRLTLKKETLLVLQQMKSQDVVGGTTGSDGPCDSGPCYLPVTLSNLAPPICRTDTDR